MKTYQMATVLILAGLLSACQQRLKGSSGARDNEVADLLQAERDASALSGKEGFVRSMITSLDDSGVLLRPHMMPAKGLAARSTLQHHPDTGYTLTWEPLDGYVAESGELGYTYGTYTLTVKATGEREQGTYATVWRKDKDDQWKMMLDVGNPGLQPAAPDTAAHE